MLKVMNEPKISLQEFITGSAPKAGLFLGASIHTKALNKYTVTVLKTLSTSTFWYLWPDDTTYRSPCFTVSGSPPNHPLHIQ